MHQTRQESSTKLPIPRKGTKYIARASSHSYDSVPVVIALRDMLNLAKTSKEVEKMIKQKLLKLNGKLVEDLHESIKLFDILEADKSYVLKLLPTRKFFFEESPKASERLCKVMGKKLLKDNKIQLNLHDGSNIIADNKIKIGDSLYLDFSGKMKKHVSLEKGKAVFILTGRYVGLEGKIAEISGKKIIVKFKENEATLPLDSIIVL
jgi:small subunit ribosomal protein S4e